MARIRIAERPCARKSGFSSRYHYKNWVWGENGERLRAEKVSPLRPEHADLINSTYLNPRKKTETLYCLTWDLDSSRTSQQWMTRDGKLKWYKIRKQIFSQIPEFSKHIFAVTRSTGGKGLSLSIAISPLELVDKTQGCQNAAKVLQWKIMTLLTSWGIGADPAALGLARDFPNWRDPKRKVFVCKEVLSAVQSEFHRDPVITDLLEELKKFPVLDYQRKRDREDLLYPDIRAERKLARLYCHILDEVLDREVYMTTGEIQKLTGLCRPMVYKLPTCRLPWLNMEWLGKAEGWRLSLNLKPEWSQRAAGLCEGQCEGDENPNVRSVINLDEPLKRPEQVKDGERNLWLTQATLRLKHSGVEEAQALAVLEEHKRQIPSYALSRNCRSLRSIVRSIYKNLPKLIGVCPGKAPKWLRSPLKSSQDHKKESRLHQIKTDQSLEKSITFKKGAEPPGSAPRQVSFDGCFLFHGSRYSVPQEFVGQKVQVFLWKAYLRVFSVEGEFICHHPYLQNGGRSIIHKREMTINDEVYFNNLLSRFSEAGLSSENLISSLIKTSPFFNYRKINHLLGLLYKFGDEIFEKAARSALGGYRSPYMGCVTVLKEGSFK